MAANDPSHPCYLEFRELNPRNLANAKSDYAKALLELKAAFPTMVCCDAFETGGCSHGTACECGWKHAPWPCIVQRSNGAFCDCHMDSRRAWMKPAGIRYWEYSVAQLVSCAT